MRRFFTPLVLIALLGWGAPTFAQNLPGNGGATMVQAMTAYTPLIPISATAAVNTQTTLTIPAPQSGFYNYVCYLGYQMTMDGTGGVVTNQVTTSTNFNSFALKVGSIAGANLSAGPFIVFNQSPAVGCAKSAVAGTATTFVSPSGQADMAFTWYAAYYQAP